MNESHDEAPAVAQKGISRRDILKLSGAVAIAAGSGGLTLRSLAWPEGARATHEDILENGAGKFLVDIPGAPEASANIHSISLNDLRVDVKEKKGLQEEFRVFGPGDAHFGSITIRAFVGPRTGELEQWFAEASSGAPAHRDISIVVLKPDGSAGRTFNLFDSFPLRWDPGEYGPSSTVQTETIVCKIGRVEPG